MMASSSPLVEGRLEPEGVEPPSRVYTDIAALANRGVSPLSTGLRRVHCSISIREGRSR